MSKSMITVDLAGDPEECLRAEFDLSELTVGGLSEQRIERLFRHLCDARSAAQLKGGI